MSTKLLLEIKKWIIQGLTIYVFRVRTYAYFYWRTHDFGHAYVDTYVHFPYDFLKFSGSYNFILFKNLLLYIWPVIYWFALGRDRFFTVYSFLKTPYFSCKLFNKYFSLAQSTCRQFRVSLYVKSDPKTKLRTLSSCCVFWNIFSG